MIRVISSFADGPVNFHSTGPAEDQIQKLISSTVFTNALHHSHGSLARSLSRPVQVRLEIFLVIADLFRLVQISLSAALEIICSFSIF